MNSLKSNKKEYSAIEKDIQKKLFNTKKFIKSNPDIMFVNSDKSNRTVIISKNEYIRKSENILNDKKTYKMCKTNPLQRIQKKVSKILKDLNKDNLLNIKYHKNALSQTNTVLAKYYSLIKTHKPGNPVRPVISTCNSPTYLLSKHLYNDLKNGIIPPKSHINNSYDLRNLLKEITIPDDYIMMSLDVSSLFSNIPYNLVKSSLDKLNESIRKYCTLPFDTILDLSKFLFDNTYFSFNGKFYRQLIGCPMGDICSPLFADLIMDDLETFCLNQLNEQYNIKTLLFVRYIDDILIFVPKTSIDIVTKIFNSYHPRLKFTHEIESNNSINFLDLTIIRNNQKIITNWYKKKSSSNRTLNYFSNHPLQLKINIIYNLVDRAIGLSDKRFHHNNLKIIKNILNENNYPKDFMTKFINKRLYKFKNQLIDNTHQSNCNKDVYIRMPKLQIPYNQNFFSKCKGILRSFNIIPIPKINKNNQNIVTLGKDKSIKWDKTGVVYKFNCKNCPVTYVGETKRSLNIRINEHKTCKKDTVVTAHMRNLGHVFDFEKTKILDNESIYKKRIISEMVHIASSHHSINKKEDTQCLSAIYKPIIRKLKV